MAGARERWRFCWTIFPSVLFVLLSDTKAADSPADNPELKQIYNADQKDREAPLGKTLDWDTINPRDTARRKRVRELIDQGRLNTGKD